MITIFFTTLILFEKNQNSALAQFHRVVNLIYHTIQSCGSSVTLPNVP